MSVKIIISIKLNNLTFFFFFFNEKKCWVFSNCGLRVAMWNICCTCGFLLIGEQRCWKLHLFARNLIEHVIWLSTLLLFLFIMIKTNIITPNKSIHWKNDLIIKLKSIHYILNQFIHVLFMKLMDFSWFSLRLVENEWICCTDEFISYLIDVF